MTMMDFNEILARVTIADILADCGYHPRRNRMPCPIHDGRNPTSFSFDDNTFCCFSCGVSGGLLDLTETLLGIDRKEALKYLADKAGIRLEDYQPGGKPITRTPARKRPVSVRDAGLFKLQVDLKGLDVLRDHFTWRLQKARKSLMAGTLDLSGYYAETQYSDYVLEDLDAEYIKINHEINIKRRGLFNGKHIRSN